MSFHDPLRQTARSEASPFEGRSATGPSDEPRPTGGGWATVAVCLIASLCTLVLLVEIGALDRLALGSPPTRPVAPAAHVLGATAADRARSDDLHRLRSLPRALPVAVSEPNSSPPGPRARTKSRGTEPAKTDAGGGTALAQDPADDPDTVDDVPPLDVDDLLPRDPTGILPPLSVPDVQLPAPLESTETVAGATVLP